MKKFFINNGLGISHLMGWAHAENTLTQDLKDIDNFIRTKFLESYKGNLDHIPYLHEDPVSDRQA